MRCILQRIKKIMAILLIVAVVATLLCISAFATVTETNGDGYALYNGVKLPNIDSVWTDKEAYPYSCIFVAGNGAITGLYIATVPFVRNSKNMLSFNSDGFLSCYTINDGSWEFAFSDTVVNNESTYSGMDVVWTNTNILNSDNSTYLAASDPISLDGYNVIEWDGNTEGLINEGNYYKISSALPPYDDFIGGYLVANSGAVVNVRLDDLIINAEQLWYSVANSVVVAFDVGAVSETGIYVIEQDGGFISLLAYRSTETPPDEGGDDDDPQPPCGVADI